MAVFRVDDIARLLPAAPGATASAIREAATEQHPGISLATVTAVLSVLVREGRAARVDQPDGGHLYHRTETQCR